MCYFPICSFQTLNYAQLLLVKMTKFSRKQQAQFNVIYPLLKGLYCYEIAHMLQEVIICQRTRT